MKLPDKVNPAACISKDATRYSLTKVRVQDGLAQATDGRVLFVAQCPADDDDVITEGYVPADALKQAAKNKFLNKGEFRFRPNQYDPSLADVAVNVNLDAETVYYGTTMDGWPRTDRVIPHQSKPFTIEFDAKLLAKLVAAFGDTIVSLTADLENPGGAIIVTSANQPAAFGILMPNNASKRQNISDHFEPIQHHTIDMLISAGVKRDAMPATETLKTAES
jgi:hypothetical protein